MYLKYSYMIISMMFFYNVHAQNAVQFSSLPQQTTMIELYSSQGCSSCPPAERWISEFIDDDDLWKRTVPIVFHVDYWNDLGWIDPFSNAAGTVSGQFLIIIFSIIFLLINGHYFLLLAIQKSFEVIPLFNAHMPTGSVANLLVSMVANVFVMAFRLSAPVFSVLVLTSLSLGIVARTVPQINIFFVGLPLKIGLGLTTLAIVLPAMAMIFRSMFEKLIQDIWRLLYLMA